MTWYETGTGGKAHKVPELPRGRYTSRALCGVLADGWDPDTDEGVYSEGMKCKTCRRRMRQILAGGDEEYEPWQVQ